RGAAQHQPERPMAVADAEAGRTTDCGQCPATDGRVLSELVLRLAPIDPDVFELHGQFLCWTWPSMCACRFRDTGNPAAVVPKSFLNHAESFSIRRLQPGRGDIRAALAG